MADPALPRLAFVYSGLETEDPPLLLAEAARDVASLVWTLPDAGGVGAPAMRMLRRLGEVLDLSGCTDDEAAELIRRSGATGLVCFNDDNLVRAAEWARRLDMRFFRPEVATRLTDKLAQRRALREAGMRTPAFWDADALADPSAIAEVEEIAGFPVVVKPRQGHGSRDVEAVGSVDRLAAAIARGTQGSMLVEAYIPDPSVPPGASGSAPYVSVELVASSGVVSVLGVTGRAPLAPPFRETGALFPAGLPPEQHDEVVATAVVAARALGVETGPLHVELKFTDAGPVVIEVNGVMGGGAIRDLMQRGLGLDVVQLTMRLAVGEHIVFAEPPRPSDVGFLFEMQPDMDARRIVAVEGLESMAEVAGVERVLPGLRAGDEVSWRTGTHAFVAAVLGAAPDHAGAERVRQEFYRRVVVTTDDGGHDGFRAP